MWDLVIKVWFFIIILPYAMAKEGWERLKKFLNADPQRAKLFWWYLPYVLLIILIFILLILLSMGYPVNGINR